MGRGDKKMKSILRVKKNIKKIASLGVVGALLVGGSVSALNVTKNGGDNIYYDGNTIYVGGPNLNINISLNSSENDIFTSNIYLGIRDDTGKHLKEGTDYNGIDSSSSKVSDGTNTANFSTNWVSADGYDLGQYAGVSDLNISKDWNITLIMNLTGLEEGKIYQLFLDNDGNVIQDGKNYIFNLVIDKTAPSLNTTLSDNVKSYEGDSNYYVNSSFNISYEVSDNVDDDVEVKYMIDSGSWTTASSSPIEISFFGKGTHTVKVRALDKVENENVTTYTIIYDKTAPNATLILDSSLPAVGNYSLINLSTFNVTVTATDDNFLKSELYVNNELVNESDSELNNSKILISNLKDGYYNITLKVYDKAYNVNESVLHVAVDTTNPTASAEVNETASYYVKDGKVIFYDPNNILINTVLEDNIELKSVDYELVNSTGGVVSHLNVTGVNYDNTSLTGTSATKLINLSSLNLADGEYNLTITVTDEANHEITETFNFEVQKDTINPSLTVNNVRYEYDEEENKYYLVGEISYSDEGSGIKSVELNYSGMPYNLEDYINDGTFKVPVSLLGKVDNPTITVTVKDLAGNTNSTNLTVSNMPDYALTLNNGINYVALEGQYDVEAPLFKQVISDLSNEENLSIKAYELLNNQWFVRDLKQVINKTDTQRTTTKKQCTTYYYYTTCTTVTVDNENYNPLYNFLLGDIIKVENASNTIQIPIYYNSEDKQPTNDFSETLEAEKWSAISFVDSKIGDKATVANNCNGKTGACYSSGGYEFNFIESLLDNYFLRNAANGKAVAFDGNVSEYKVFYILPKTQTKIFSPFSPSLPQ